jgi:hypothetical protein
LTGKRVQENHQAGQFQLLLHQLYSAAPTKIRAIRQTAYSDDGYRRKQSRMLGRSHHEPACKLCANCFKPKENPEGRHYHSATRLLTCSAGQII